MGGAGRGRRGGQHVGDRGELVAGPLVAATRDLSGIDGLPAGSVDHIGLTTAHELVQRRRLAGGVGKQAGVVVGDQEVHRLRGARLVGPDESRRPALDPAGDVTTRRANDAAAVIGHHGGGLVERQPTNRLAAVAN